MWRARVSDAPRIELLDSHIQSTFRRAAPELLQESFAPKRAFSEDPDIASLIRATLAAFKYPRHRPGQRAGTMAENISQLTRAVGQINPWKTALAVKTRRRPEIDTAPTFGLPIGSFMHHISPTARRLEGEYGASLAALPGLINPGFSIKAFRS
jgi:hypothetical protein